MQRRRSRPQRLLHLKVLFAPFPAFSFLLSFTLFERWAAWVAVSPGQTGAYFVGISPTFFFRVCFWHRAKGMSWQRKKGNF